MKYRKPPLMGNSSNQVVYSGGASNQADILSEKTDQTNNSAIGPSIRRQRKDNLSSAYGKTRHLPSEGRLAESSLPGQQPSSNKTQ